MIAAPTALTLPLRTPTRADRPPLRPAEVRSRFTTDGSLALEEHLDTWCARIAAGVRGLVGPARLEALLLGGGYGRGEGGVLRTPAGDRPYNDVEFYVFLHGNRHVNERRFGRALHVLGEILTAQVGAEVEFKIASLPELERAEVSMFSYDLLSGHRLLCGRAESLARCAGHRDAERIAPAEATRLLMNRCSGLLFAQERLARATPTAADLDFVRRNIAKAQLALGDALLVVFGQYHWSARERHRLVERLTRTQPMAWLEAVRRHHATGVEFKLHPFRSNESIDALRADHRDLVQLSGDVFLWLEGRRLAQVFDSARAYAAHPVAKFPVTAPGRMLLQQIKVFGPRALVTADVSTHPRDRVLHALALLLWAPRPLEDPATRQQIQRELDTDATTFPAVVAAYQARWQLVN